jgi:hemophore-related protein
MPAAIRSTRGSLFRAAAVTLGVAGAVLIASPGPAAADPLPPGCTTADMTGVMSGISAAMSAYLLTHPDVNNFFTGLQGQPKTAVRDQTEAYLNANPNVRADLEGIRQPSRDFRARCNLPQRALVLADVI